MDIYPLKTRLAKGVAVILGNVKEVQKLDRKRCKLKDVLKSKYPDRKARSYRRLRVCFSSTEEQSFGRTEQSKKAV